MCEQKHIICYFCLVEASKANQNQSCWVSYKHVWNHHHPEDFAMRQRKLLRMQNHANPASKPGMLLSSQVRTCTEKLASVYSHQADIISICKALQWSKDCAIFKCCDKVQGIRGFVANAYAAALMLPLMFDSILFDYSVFCIFWWQIFFLIRRESIVFQIFLQTKDFTKAPYKLWPKVWLCPWQQLDREQERCGGKSKHTVSLDVECLIF